MSCLDSDAKTNFMAYHSRCTHEPWCSSQNSSQDNLTSSGEAGSIARSNPMRIRQFPCCTHLSVAGTTFSIWLCALQQRISALFPHQQIQLPQPHLHPGHRLHVERMVLEELPKGNSPTGILPAQIDHPRENTARERS